MPQPMAAQAYPIAYPGGNYGYVWNLPQWAPATSMALFVPGMHGHMQYAGQQAPDSAIPAGSQVRPPISLCTLWPSYLVHIRQDLACKEPSCPPSHPKVKKGS